MRPLLALTLAVSLLSQPALAGPQPSRADMAKHIASLEARLAALESSASLGSVQAPASAPSVSVPVLSKAPPLPPSVAPFAMMRRGLMAIGGPLIALPGPPIFGYPGYGGGGTPTSLSNIGLDNVTPPDGTFNVIGAISSTGAIDAGGNLTVNGGNVLRWVDNNVNIAESGTNDMQLRAAGSDFLFTSDGGGAATGTITVDGSGNLSLNKTIAATTFRVAADTSASFCAGTSGTEACFGRDGTDDGAQISSGIAGIHLNAADASRGIRIINGQLQHRVVSVTVADSGGGGAAAFTITITTGRGSHYEITCNDADGCAGTFAETAPLQGGTEISIVNLSANNVTFADSAGVQLVSGASITVGQHDRVNFRYDSDAVWRQDTAVLAVE